MNKIQQLAKKVNIERQTDFRERLALFGVPAGTAWKIWTDGATSRNDYYVVFALEKVLLVSPMQFLNDPESLLPKKQTIKGNNAKVE